MFGFQGTEKIYSSIAQSVERMTVNHDVVGSSPTWGVDVSIEANEIVYGSVVKRLRHRPFTAVTRVRFSSESFIRSFSSVG